MIDVTSSVDPRYFLDPLLIDFSPLSSEAAALVFMGVIFPSDEGVGVMAYREDGTVFFPEGYATYDAQERMLDIPDEIDPDQASTSAVVATYRVSDGAWWVGVEFGPGASRWDYTPSTYESLAAEVCPL